MPIMSDYFYYLIGFSLAQGLHPGLCCVAPTVLDDVWTAPFICPIPRVKTLIWAMSHLRCWVMTSIHISDIHNISNILRAYTLGWGVSRLRCWVVFLFHHSIAICLLSLKSERLV